MVINMEADNTTPLVENGVFWTATITAIVGCLLKTMSMAYKSKCKEVSFCCIKIIRDVKAETSIDRITTTTPATNTENNI